MSIFGGFGGIQIQQNGTTVPGIEFLNLENGTVTKNGDVLNYSAPSLDVTNGTLSVVNTGTLTIGSGLVLTAPSIAPTIAQAIYGDQSQTIQLPNVPNAGNIVLYFVYETTGSTVSLPGTPLVTQTDAGCSCYILYETADGLTNTGLTLGGTACGAIMEIEGGTISEYGGQAISLTGTGPYTVSISETLNTAVPNLILTVGRATSTDLPGGLTPAGMSILSSQSFYNSGQATGEFFKIASYSGSSPLTVSYTQAGNAAAGSPIAYIALAGEASGNTATIAT